MEEKRRSGVEQEDRTDRTEQTERVDQTELTEQTDRTGQTDRMDSTPQPAAASRTVAMDATGRRWVRLCGAGEVPLPGQVTEAIAEGVALCLANVRGELCALDNQCPHRQGPLGQGWIEGDLVVCPWHSWSFHAKTGVADYPNDQRVEVFPLRREGDEVLVLLGARPAPAQPEATALPNPGRAEEL